MTATATGATGGRLDEATAEALVLLAEVPLFAGLGRDGLRTLAGRTGWARIEAGGVLFTQGDPGESLYVVHSGRVEILVDGIVVSTHGRGGVFGELAPLVGGRRSATVVARRDTELLVLDRPSIDPLLANPAVAAALLRLVAGHLPGVTTRRPPTVVDSVLALVPAHDGLPVEAIPKLAERLVAALGGVFPVARLDVGGRPVGDEEDWAGRLERAEAAHRHVLLVSAAPDGEWTRFCLRQSDRSLLLADPRRSAPDDRKQPASAQVVAWHHGDATPLTRGGWVTGPRSAVHHLDAAMSPATVGRMARRIAGRSLGLVLSGGGARGLAHVGVLEVFAREGIVVDRLGGTSMGAVVGGVSALGADPAEMLDLARRDLIRARAFGDVTWPRHALTRGRRVDRTLARLFGAVRLEDLSPPLFTVSADLVSARAVVHRRGSLAEAVGLSVRLPGVTPPRRIGDRLHVDGGVVDNLPIGTMADDGEGPVVACDVAMPFDAPADMASVGARRLPHIVDTIARSMTLASWSRGTGDRDRARTVITPALGGIGMFDFARVDDIVDAGRRAAEVALPAIRAAVAT